MVSEGDDEERQRSVDSVTIERGGAASPDPVDLVKDPVKRSGAKDGALVAITSAAATYLARMRSAEVAYHQLVRELKKGDALGLSDQRMSDAVTEAIPLGTTVMNRLVTMSNMAVRRALRKAAPK